MVQRVIQYLNYLIRSKVWGHGIHAPFAFRLVKDVIDVPANFYAFAQIEAIRKLMIKDSTRIHLLDFGAGSKMTQSNDRSIRSIANSSLKRPKYAQLIFRLIDYFGYKQILELGTSLGITTAYMASSSKDIQVITIDGDPSIAKLAQNNFNKLNLDNITLINATFEQVLEDALKNLNPVDLVFIDGHHTFDATMNYFNTCLQYKHNNSLFVIDDINWSAGMRQAWTTIKNNNEVTLTVDLYEMGLVFFRKENTKEHITVFY